LIINQIIFFFTEPAHSATTIQSKEQMHQKLLKLRLVKLMKLLLRTALRTLLPMKALKTMLLPMKPLLQILKLLSDLFNSKLLESKIKKHKYKPLN